MGKVQLPLGCAAQPKLPGPSAPRRLARAATAAAGVQPEHLISRGSGSGLGGYGGAGANEVPCCVAWSHSQAEIVTATVVAAEGAPHSAWAQARTVVPL